MKKIFYDAYFGTAIRRRVPVSVLFAVLLYSTPLFAETLYVKTDGTKITAEPSGSSKVVAVVNAGDKLEGMEQKGRFYRVRSQGGETGWVFAFRVVPASKRGSQEKDSGNLFAALGGDRSIHESEAASQASIRGLNKVSEDHARSQGTAQEYIDAVKRMERYQVTPREIDSFLKEGNLGEYVE
jgi:hypothetical protein